MLETNIKNQPLIEFDPSFVEEAVFLAVKYNEKEGNESIIRNFHNEREKIYQRLTDEDRNASFQQLYNEYFNKLEIKDIFEKIVRDFPLLHQPNISLFIKKVWSKKEEDTELYVDGDLKTVYIALMANRILQPLCIQAVLRHDLLRISDMLDPRFQYNPFIHLDGKHELENNLIKDRFRILWDMSIDARLREKGYPTIKSREEQKKVFEKTFFFLNENERKFIYFKLVGCDSLMHIDLLNWAQDARSVKTLGEGGVRCPLCDFTCYDPIKNWSQEALVVANEVKKDHPQWSLELGLCPQCYDFYSCKVKAEV
jgi:hypothetical protein